MAEMWINMGPQHPMTHGLWNLRVKVDGETILEAIPELGYLHRGMEKQCENRTYPQLVPILDRLCYAACLSWSTLYCQTVEELMGIKIPERAEYIRVITLEMQRIASHLVWLPAFAADLGQLTMFLYPLRERELFIDLFQMLTGARLTYDYPRIGGVRSDLPQAFPEKLNEVMGIFEKRIVEYEAMIDDNELFLMRTIDVGKVSAEDAINLGMSGPCLRGSGVVSDLRRDDPYSIYDRFDFAVCVEKEGDCYARYRVRMNEMKESMSIIRQALKGIPEGPIMAEKVPRRAPKGEAFGRMEDPRGDASMYIIGNGSEKPYRVKIKSPAFINISACPKLLVGNRVADVPAIMGSVDVCIGETDR